MHTLYFFDIILVIKKQVKTVAILLYLKTVENIHLKKDS